MIDVPVKVKDALREGTYRKNYRFNVLNDDGTIYQTIENNNLVKESVSIDERMNSGDKLKFGLCEGSSLEFQYFGLENFTGRRIQAFIEVEYDATGDYVKVDEFEEGVESTIMQGGDYRAYSNTPNAWTKTIVTSEYTPTEYTPTSTATETIQILDGLDLWDSVEVVWDSIDPATHPVELQKMVEGLQWYTIPMGFFTVEKCSRQASTGIIKVTAYNKLMSDYLDAKANELIQEEFDFTPTVYVSDLIDALLKEYSIKELKYEEQETAPVGLWDTAISDATSNYKYRSLYNDQGPFGPAVLSRGRIDPITTNTNVYFKTYAHVARYTNLSDYPIKIDVPDYWDAIDEKIALFYQRQLQLISATVSAETLWSRIKSAKSTSTAVPSRYMTNYMFNVTVVFTDQSKKTYGNNVTNGNGSFSDMKKLTFLNVSEVYILYPRCVLFTDNGGVGLASPGNTVYCTGADRPYLYQLGQGQELLTNTYSTPKMDDGTDIPEWEVAKTLCSVYKIIGGTSDADFIEVNIEDLPDVTLRELQSASFETICQFGQLSRITDLFSGVELNYSRLLPADTLYPNDALYPDGAHESAFRSQYSKLWADEGNVHKWRYLIITYKGLDQEGNEIEKTLQRTIDEHGTDNYNCSDNWLFRNLVWAEEDVGAYADAMVEKMQNITWFPFEMWAAGLPYLETGDEIEIPLGENTYTSYILQRQLKGIQNLQDTYINGTLDIF